MLVKLILLVGNDNEMMFHVTFSVVVFHVAFIVTIDIYYYLFHVSSYH